MNFDSARDTCHLLGGKIPLARSAADMNNMFRRIDRQLLSWSCQNHFWAPVQRSLLNNSLWEYRVIFNFFLKICTISILYLVN